MIFSFFFDILRINHVLLWIRCINTALLQTESKNSDCASHNKEFDKVKKSWVFFDISTSVCAFANVNPQNLKPTSWWNKITNSFDWNHEALWIFYSKIVNLVQNVMHFKDILKMRWFGPKFNALWFFFKVRCHKNLIQTLT